MTDKTVALYIRVSTKHQDTPEGSLISQEQRLVEWYDYHNSQAKFSEDKLVPKHPKGPATIVCL